MKTSRIFGILISLALIIGGLSGKLVLRGTNSSTALVIVGILFLIYEIYAAVKESKLTEDEDTSHYDQSPRSNPLRSPAPPKVERTEAEWHAYFGDILRKRFPQYIVKENVPVTELTGDISDVFTLYERRPDQVYKAEWGRPYDFVLYSGDKAKAAVMLGDGHSHSNQVKYLISKMFAKKLQIPYVGFYTQFPNSEEYVVGRVRGEIVEA